MVLVANHATSIVLMSMETDWSRISALDYPLLHVVKPVIYRVPLTVWYLIGRLGTPVLTFADKIWVLRTELVN